MAGSGVVALPTDTRSIDARSIVTLIVFFIVNTLVIFPIAIPLPFFLSRFLSKALGRSGRGPDGTERNSEQSEEKTDGEIGAPATNNTHLATAKITAPPEGLSETISASGESPRDAGKDKKQAHTPERAQEERWYFPLGLETAPVIGVLVLLAGTCIDGGVLRDGIVGRGGVRPYDIMTLFISFAYIALSLDRTNLLRYLAFHVATRSASSGRQLYLSFFGFFSLLGLIVGNDPLILSGTPFLAHFSRLASIPDSTAYLFTQFQTANLVSALLVSSNPTNLVLTSAFGVSFLSYSAWLALPTIAALIVLFPVLRWWVFRKDGMIPLKLTPPTLDPANALHDPWGAVIGGCLFLVTIVVMIALSAVGKLEGVEGVWTVTAPAAILIMLRDAAYDLMKRKEGRVEVVKKTSEKARQEEGKERKGTPESGDESIPNNEGVKNPSTAAPPESRLDTTDDVTAITPDQTRIVPTLQTRTQTLDPPARNLAHRLFPTVTDIITHLPLALIPFAFAMFMLVESLQHTGWIRVWGGWWAAWADAGGVAGCVFMMGLISVIGCNIFGTNIGATVLLSRVLQQWVSSRAQGSISPRMLYGSVFALAVGSNFGAYSFVFPASLAGLLWRHLLKQKDMVLTRKEFARWNWVSLVVTMIVGCMVVAGEVCVMYDW